MANYEKHLFIALTLSMLVMLLNIIAVTSGAADSYYLQLSEWLNSI